MQTKRDLKTLRFLELIDQLAGDARMHGWKKRVSDQLGIHPSYLTMLLRDDSRCVGERVIMRALKRLGIRPLFFEQESGHYRDLQIALPSENVQLANAAKIADDWWKRGHDPNHAEARQLALNVVRGADVTLKELIEIRDLCMKIIMASDKDAAQLGQRLATLMFVGKGITP